jgi:hypothetical protein
MPTPLIVVFVVLGAIILILSILYGVGVEARKQAEAARVAQEIAERREEAKRKRKEEEARLKAEEEARRIQEEKDKEAQRLQEEKNGIFRLRLTPGVEAFTPVALTHGKQFKITFQGTYRYKHWGWHDADACWYAPEVNFDREYKKLLIDSKSNGCRLFEDDRHTHVYSFLYVGTGKKLSLLICAPEKKQPETKGFLSVLIGPPSAEDQARLGLEVTALQNLEEERRRQTARQEREEKKRVEMRNQELEAAQRADILARIKNLKIRSHLEKNILDPLHRENLATYHRHEILKARDTIFEEYGELMRDDGLIEALGQEAPEVLEFMEAIVELFQLAERKEAETPKQGALPAPQTPSRPRQRLSEEEVRARKAYRKLRQARDTAAEKLAVLDSVLEFQESLEKYQLDEDEKTRVFQEYYDEITVEEAGNGGGKKLG